MARAPPGRGARLGVAALLLTGAALLLNASALLPLWEVAGEAAAVRQAQRWAGGATSDEPELLAGVADAPTAVLPRALLAAGLRLAGLQDTTFLARPRPADDPRGAAQYLHGPDEQLPFAGPARALHGLRLLSVACGLVAALGTWALARRLLPRRPGAAWLALALVIANPVFLAACAGLGDVAPALALSTWSLVALADLAARPVPSARHGLLTGALLGGTVLCGVPALPLAGMTLLAVLLGRPRGAGWRAALRPLDALAAGFLLVAGPVLAWQSVAGADAPFAPAAAPAASAAARVPDWLALVSFSFVALPTEGVRAGPGVLLLWSTLAALGGSGLLVAAARGRRDTAGPNGRIALLLLAAVLLAGAASLVASLQGRPPRGRDLLPVAGALAALLAAGCAAWLPASWPRRAAAAGALAVAALLLAAGWHEAVKLGPAFVPLNRAQDTHLLCFDALAGVPDERRLPTLHVLQPADGSRQLEPPELRWEPAADPEARYTVHLRTPGAAFHAAAFEAEGQSFRDRCRVPAALWQHVPPDVDLVAQVLRLPTLAEVLSDQPLLVDESPPVHVRRGPDQAPGR